MSCRVLWRCCALVLVVLVTPFPNSAAGALPAVRPFDPAVPQLAADIPLPRWERARAALADDRVSLAACVAERAACGDPRRVAWRDLVRRLAEAPPIRQLEAVNAFVNAVPYAGDDVAYGVRDYWAGPWEFLVGRGDCEDYAIAKYATLRQLGFPAEAMRIMVVDDVVRGLAHAVLAVRTPDGIWLLDNQHEAVLDATMIRRYAPYYAVNEDRRWLYRMPDAAPAR